MLTEEKAKNREALGLNKYCHMSYEDDSIDCENIYCNRCPYYYADKNEE